MRAFSRADGLTGNSRAAGSVVQRVRTRLAGLLSCLAVVLAIASHQVRGESAPIAPPFPTADPARWIGTPQTWESLRGHVVLLDVWTFG